MKRAIKNLIGHSIRAMDGEMGKVHDFYFDDAKWTIRYLVVDTGGWLTGRKVLISPTALRPPDWENRSLPVNLTKDQVRNSPPTDTDKPVSRQHETELHAYYAWPAYWGIPGYPFPSTSSMPGAPLSGIAAVPKEATPEERGGDPHLRSTNAVTGHHVQASDGEIGHVEDFVVDDEAWVIRYVIVNTRNWLPGRKVLVSPQWIERVSWSEKKVCVSLTQDAIKSSPEFDPSQPIQLDYETEIHDHYRRPKYWH